MALGTPYTGVVARVQEIVERIGQCAVVVDGTGVGEPVVDVLRRAGLGCEITAVTITGGERQSRGGSICSVPKQDLIAGVRMAMEKVRMGADGYGEHDDLVIALALACRRARRREIGFGTRRLPGI